jgi:hypothetical protein
MRWMFCALFLAGCAQAGGPPASNGGGNATPTSVPLPLQGLQKITVTPPDVTLVVDGTTPATQTYRAVGTFSDHQQDITDLATFSLSDGTLGLFQGSELTTAADRGGVANVQASAGGIWATTGLTVMIRRKLVDPSSSLPPNVDARFAGADDPSRAPDIVYPNDGVLLPPNFGGLEIHFLPGAHNTVFEVAFTNGLTDVRVYTTCQQPVNGGCIFPVPAGVWKTLAQTNRGLSAVNVVVAGTDAAGSSVGHSSPVAFSLSEDDLLGAMYYWTTSNGTGIMRFDFSDPGQTAPQKFAGPSLAGGKCIGCHALSRDGSKLLAEAGGQNSGELLLLDVAKGQPIVPFPAGGRSTFESWSPDGTQFVGVYGDQGATDFDLLLFDGNTGLLTSTIGGTGSAAHPADHPDWAPDGNHIVYTKVGFPNTLQRMSRGSIQLLAASVTGWGVPAELVPALDGKNRYYPSFSPDSAFIVFDESTCSNGVSGDDCDADTDPTATLFAVTASPGASPIVLAKANAPGRLDGTTALANSFPKFAPFVFKRVAGGSAGGEMGARLNWVTFSSSRYYGLRAPPPATADEGAENTTGSLIWMTAVDPDAIAAGSDGSYPAFAIPFQDVTTSNHIAQWTTQLVPPIQ